MTLLTLELTGLQAAVVAASSGVSRLEVAVLMAGSVDHLGIATVHELAPAAVVILTDRAGNLL